MTLYGPHQTSPLESVASAAVRGARSRLEPVPARTPLTPQERVEATELVKNDKICHFCGGIHVAVNSPACPRLASGKINQLGQIVEFAFWPRYEWDTSRVIFAEDIEEDTDDNGED